MKKLLVLAACALFLGAAAPAPQDAPEAVLVKVEGPVEVKVGDAAARDAAVGVRLSAGDQILPGSGGRAVVVYRTGVTREVTSSLTIEAPAGQEAGDLFSRTVQVLAQAASSDARNQPNRQGMIRPIAGSPEIISPRNEVTVLSPHPTFQWFPVENAPGYIVQIRRREGGEILRYETGTDTIWVLPESAPPLIPGESYLWAVGPAGRGRVSREMSFRVLGQEESEEVHELLQTLVAVGLDPAGDGAFLAAVLYRDAGLLYHAAEALELLESSGVPLGVDAYLLKGEIMDALGDLAAAQAAFDRADRLGR